jgi:hypothetical protein
MFDVDINEIATSPWWIALGTLIAAFVCLVVCLFVSLCVQTAIPCSFRMSFNFHNMTEREREVYHKWRATEDQKIRRNFTAIYDPEREAIAAHVKLPPLTQMIMDYTYDNVHPPSIHTLIIKRAGFEDERMRVVPELPLYTVFQQYLNLVKDKQDQLDLSPRHHSFSWTEARFGERWKAASGGERVGQRCALFFRCGGRHERTRLREQRIQDDEGQACKRAKKQRRRARERKRDRDNEE